MINFAIDMKKLVYKSISFLLSLIVLLSTFSFTVESHYCGEELVDVALFSEANGCEEDTDHDDTIPDSSEEISCCGSQDRMHCKDVLTEIEGDPVDYFGFEKPVLQKVFFVATFLATYQYELYELNEETVVFQNSSPPILQRDRIVLFDNFRI